MIAYSCLNPSCMINWRLLKESFWHPDNSEFQKASQEMTNAQSSFSAAFLWFHGKTQLRVVNKAVNMSSCCWIMFAHGNRYKEKGLVQVQNLVELHDWRYYTKRKHHKHEQTGVYLLHLIQPSPIPVTCSSLCKRIIWSAVSKEISIRTVITFENLGSATV